MADRSARYGLVLSTVGAIMLALSVFLPWYALSLTPGGVSFVQQVGGQVASQFGNATLQRYMSTADAHLSGLSGRQFAAVSAHQLLHVVSVVLLIAAALAILITMLGLAGAEPERSEGARAPLAAIGALAAVCVLFRMVDPPSVTGGVFALSLREGAWLALLGSVAIVAGALWPRPGAGSVREPGTDAKAALASLSGWTPQA
jgi:hypothetical protein